MIKNIAINRSLFLRNSFLNLYNLLGGLAEIGSSAMALVAVTIFLCYGFADYIGRVLGETGTIIVIRLAAFLLLCIGVQIVWNGFDALLESIKLQAQ
jgi:multiple antibiotic resistance protein